MKIVLLGTAGYHPNETRHTSCLMLPELNLVLDAGTGFFRVRDHAAPGRLDVFLTHFHTDHICGLHYLLDVVHERPIDEVHIWGPEGLDKMLARFFKDPFFPVSLEDHPLRIRTHELTRKLSHAVRGAKIRAERFDHPSGGSLGYRIEYANRTFVFITDTIADVQHAEFAHKADLLIHECYFRDIDVERAKTTGHSYSRVVGQFAAAAKVRRLALVHISPLDPEPEHCLREVMDHFEETFIAYDKMEITI